ncbi:MAG: HAD family hydrolase [Candidatus Binatia bacterium]
MIKCVALDIDDTLIQTSRAQGEAMRRLAEYLEKKSTLACLEGRVFSTLETIISYFGTGNEQEFLYALCFEGGKRGTDLEQMVKEVSEYYGNQFFSLLKPFPQCEVLLEELAALGVSLGIISNGQEELQNLKLASTGLYRYFPFPERILISSSLGQAADKPSPVMYHHFIEKSHCLPWEVLFVGDKLSDIVGANLAGMISVWVLQGKTEKYRHEEFRPSLRIEKADYVIQEIGALSTILQKHTSERRAQGSLPGPRP